jgi:hypothetical protein
LCGDPSLPIGISRISLFETTFAVTLTALDWGVNSPTLASTGSLFFSKKPSTAKLFQHLIYIQLTKFRISATLKAFGDVVSSLSTQLLHFKTCEPFRLSEWHDAVFLSYTLEAGCKNRFGFFLGCCACYFI